MPETTPCRSCGAPIVWVRTPAGKAVPLDPKVLTVVTEGGQYVRGRQSHWASCPTAHLHRKPKGEATADGAAQHD